MTLGLILILIALIPFTIYLYLINKQLKITIKKLEQENKTILERKILNKEQQDTFKIESINHKKEEKLFMDKKNLVPKEEKISEPKIENLHCRSGIPLTNNNDNNFNIKDFYKEYKPDINIINEKEKTIKKEDKKTKSSKEISFIVDEKDETSAFIENLKTFRNNLKS